MSEPQKVRSYLSPLNIPAGACGAWKVVKRTYPENHPFTTANLRCQLFGGQEGKKITFPHPTTYHFLTEEEEVWMSDLPCEQAQMEACLADAHGRVLVGGLGLGLALFYLAHNPEVTDVTVVERSPEVISLVGPYCRIRPDQLVEADLFYHLKETDQTYDTAFYDIWASDGEGTLLDVVLPLHHLSVGKVKSRPVCWNEDVMRGQLYTSLTTRMLFTNPVVRARLGVKSDNYLDPAVEVPGKNGKWVNWSIPFFRWLRDENPSEADAQTGMQVYRNIYGLPGWEVGWEQFTASRRDEEENKTC